MKQFQNAFVFKLEEIVNLQTELQSQEDMYISFRKANEPHDVLREILIKINQLKTQLKEKETDALKFFS